MCVRTTKKKNGCNSIWFFLWNFFFNFHKYFSLVLFSKSLFFFSIYIHFLHLSLCLSLCLSIYTTSFLTILRHIGNFHFHVKRPTFWSCWYRWFWIERDCFDWAYFRWAIHVKIVELIVFANNCTVLDAFFVDDDTCCFYVEISIIHHVSVAAPIVSHLILEFFSRTKIHCVLLAAMINFFSYCDCTIHSIY